MNKKKFEIKFNSDLKSYNKINGTSLEIDYKDIEYDIELEYMNIGLGWSGLRSGFLLTLSIKYKDNKMTYWGTHSDVNHFDFDNSTYYHMHTVNNELFKSLHENI